MISINVSASLSVISKWAYLLTDENTFTIPKSDRVESVMKKKYGKTWWGEQWLKALENIDEANRIPRGKNYANKGAVLWIDIKNGRVDASVQGSKRTPYRISLNFKQLVNSQKQKIYEIVRKRTSIMLALAQHKLPESLNQLLLESGISLFPKDWRYDIKADCSCPDYAIPCKHIAAVLYKLSEEIDCDPFVVFKLRGCDLKEMISDFKLSEQHLKITDISDYYSGRSNFKKDVDDSRMDQVDFSTIHKLKDITLGLLNEQPPFAQDNFIGKVHDFYQHLERKAILSELKFNFSAELDNIRAKYPEFDTWNDIFCPSGMISHVEEFGQSKGKKKNLKIEQIIDFLQIYPATHLNLLNHKLRFLRCVLLFTIQLMKKSALVPQIIHLDEKQYTILQMPALYDDGVCEIVNELIKISPKIIPDIKSAHGQLVILISSFVYALLDPDFLVKSKVLNYEDSISCMFFAGSIIEFSDVSDRAIPGAIDKWLRKLRRKLQKICLMIGDKDGCFDMDIKIIEKDELIPIDVSLKKMKPEEHLELLSDISSLSVYLPEIADIIDGHKPRLFTAEEFTTVFTSILPILKTIGVQVMLPKSLRNILTPRVSLRVKSDAKSGFAGVLDLSSILDFKWEIAIGDQIIDIDAFKKLMKKSKGLVKIMNNYVMMDEKQITKMLSKYEEMKKRSLTSFEILQAGLAGCFETVPVNIDANFQNIIERIKNYKPRDVPENLNATLRPYQKNGYSWILQNISMGFGCILADDMGLGKTLQTISVILYLKNTQQLSEGKVLVVAPSSLIMNWRNEISKFAPDLKVNVYHGSSRDMNGNFDVMLTSYVLLQRDLKKINKCNWFLEIIDEAQNIKNPVTKQTKAVKAIDAQHKIALSGTPIENRLLDYWSIFDFTNSGYLGNKTTFSTNYAFPIERQHNMEILCSFKKITAPFILRRCKNDKSVISDLPDKIENNYYYSLSPTQATLYQQILNAQLETITNSDGIERKGLVFKLLNDLKQVCNHPAQYSKRDIGEIDESGKTKLLVDLLENIYDLGEKTLIFTQFTQMGDLLVKMLESRFMTKILFFHGGLSIKKKQEIIDSFQNSAQNRILIVSLKAGGAGLNLTAASHVIHYDLWWNPAVERQASDRAYRIGQHKNVMIYRLMCENTLEKKIDDLIQKKKHLSDIAVSDNESWLTNLSDDQLKDLVALRSV